MDGDASCGVALLWLLSLVTAIESEIAAPGVRLVTAKRDLSASVPTGSTLRYAGMGPDGRLRGISTVTGKSVSFANRHVELKRRGNWTLDDIRHAVVLDNTFSRPSGPYARFTSEAHSQRGRPGQGAFLICPSTAKLRSIVHALIIHCQRSGAALDEQFVWLDAICLDYTRKGPLLSADQLQTALPQRIARFEQRMVFVDAWTGLGALQQLECVWETVLAADCMAHDTPLIPVASARSHAQFAQAIALAATALRQTALLHAELAVGASAARKADAGPLADALRRRGAFSARSALVAATDSMFATDVEHAVDMTRAETGGTGERFAVLLLGAADAFKAAGKFDSAGAALEEAAGVCEAFFGACNAESARVRLLMFDLVLARPEGDAAAAADALDAAEAVEKELPAESTREKRRLSAELAMRRGKLAMRAGDAATALQHLERALELFSEIERAPQPRARRSASTEPPEYTSHAAAQVLSELVDVYFELDRPEDALTSAQNASATMSFALGKRDLRTLEAEAQLARAAERAGVYARAAAVYGGLVRVWGERSRGEACGRLAEALLGVARTQRDVPAKDARAAAHRAAVMLADTHGDLHALTLEARTLHSTLD